MSKLQNISVEELNDSSYDVEDNITIIQDIDIRIVQEEIEALKKKKSLIKDWGKTKTWFIWTLFALSIPFSFLALGIVFQFAFGQMGIAVVPVIVAFSALFAALEIAEMGSKPLSLRRDKEIEINSKRQELFEKSLKVKLVNKAEVSIDEKWREVIAFDENDDYVKFLTRIVENTENGYETIEAKRLKS